MILEKNQIPTHRSNNKNLQKIRNVFTYIVFEINTTWSRNNPFNWFCR